jgi:hypothetical protein
MSNIQGIYGEGNSSRAGTFAQVTCKFQKFGNCCVSINYLIRGLCSNTAATSVVFCVKKWVVIT